MYGGPVATAAFGLLCLAGMGAAAALLAAPEAAARALLLRGDAGAAAAAVAAGAAGGGGGGGAALLPPDARVALRLAGASLLPAAAVAWCLQVSLVWRRGCRGQGAGVGCGGAVFTGRQGSAAAGFTALQQMPLLPP